jgi:transposase
MSKTIAPKKKACNKARDGKIKFLPEETVHVGIDVHKKTYSVTLWSEQRQALVTRWTQPAIPAVLVQSLAKYRENIEHAVYEAGPTGYELVRALRAAGFCADVIAPSRTPKTTGQEAKSDRLDSRKLAMWSAKNLLQPIRVPTNEQEEDREIFRARNDAVKKRRRIKQQIKSFLPARAIEEPPGLSHWSLQAVAALRAVELGALLRFRLHMLLGDLDHCDAQVRKADGALRELAQTERHAKLNETLQSVPGVGPVTAAAIATELIAPERFDNGREVAAMAGLAPLVTRTGDTTRQGPLMKCGNARLRTILIEAPWRWKAQDLWAGELYRHLAANTGNPKKAIAAVARRLLIVLWRMSVTGEPYRPRAVETLTESEKSPAGGKRRQLGAPNKKKGESEANRTPARSRRRPLSVRSPR